MKALTLLRPWSNAIIRFGKDVENRTWAPASVILGQRIAIHSGREIDERGIGFVMSMLRNDRTAFAMHSDELLGPPMSIIGTVKLVGVVRQSSSQWFSGPIGWQLADPRPLREPLFCRGMQRLWTVPPEIEEIIRESL